MARTKTEKKNKRIRSKMRNRAKVQGSDTRPRICVFKSSKHMYVQLISDASGKTLVSASTLDKEVQAMLKGDDKGSTKSVAAAKAVGTVFAKRALSSNISEVKFDRNGFIYTGRVKAVADGAREAGLAF